MPHRRSSGRSHTGCRLPESHHLREQRDGDGDHLQWKPACYRVLGTSGIGNDTHQYNANLLGVPNASHIVLTLNVTDSLGNTGNVLVPTDVLLGDSNADGTTNSADVSQTKARSGQVVDGSNFRSDVTVEGTLNSADVSLVKTKSGAALP